MTSTGIGIQDLMVTYSRSLSIHSKSSNQGALDKSYELTTLGLTLLHQISFGSLNSTELSIVSLRICLYVVRQHFKKLICALFHVRVGCSFSCIPRYTAVGYHTILFPNFQTFCTDLVSKSAGSSMNLGAQGFDRCPPPCS